MIIEHDKLYTPTEKQVEAHMARERFMLFSMLVVVIILLLDKIIE